jgi:hypothetical protein
MIRIFYGYHLYFKQSIYKVVGYSIVLRLLSEAHLPSHIFEGKILGSEDLIIQVLEVMLNDSINMTLGNIMYIVKNVAAPNDQHHSIANLFF